MPSVDLLKVGPKIAIRLKRLIIISEFFFAGFSAPEIEKILNRIGTPPSVVGYIHVCICDCSCSCFRVLVCYIVSMYPCAGSGALFVW